MQYLKTTFKPFGGWRELMQIAWPLIISSGSFAVLNLSDRLFLSWHSEAAFRAALPAGVLFFTLVCGFMALAGFTSTFVAQFLGAGDHEGCGRATAQGILLALIATPLILLLQFAGIWMLRLSGHEPAVFEMEKAYFSILMWSGGGMAMSAAFSGFFSGRGLTAVVMGCNIAANILNVALNYILIFGHCGFPALGIIGAGWATVIGTWFCPLLFAVIYFSKHNRTHFGTWRLLRFDRDLFSRMLRFGVPSGIHWFLDVASFTIFVLLVGRLSSEAHVASNIALSVNLIAFMPMTGMGMAASILTGQYLGRSQPAEARRAALLAWKIGVVYVAIIGVSFLLFPGFYAHFFEGRGDGAIMSAELIASVRNLLAMLAVWGIADTSAIIISGALKGAGDTRFVMWYQSVAAWGIWVPGLLLLMLHFEIGLYGSWLWTLIYILLLALGYISRFRSDRWLSIDLLGRKTLVAEALQPTPLHEV